MSDVLLLRLLNTNAPNSANVAAQWLHADARGGRLGVVMEGALADATTMAQNRKVIVVVPGATVHLSKPILPMKRGAQLEQVMRYALEENLASDIDDLHFAMTKQQSDGCTPVAVVEHTQMESWLAALAAANIVPDALYSESNLTPPNSVVIDGELIHARLDGLGTTLDAQPLDEVLRLAFGATANIEKTSSSDAGGPSADSAPIAKDVFVYIQQNEYAMHGATIEALRDQLPNIQIKLLPEGPLPLFAPQATHGAINLLTGKYARKKSWNKALAPWRIAALLAGIMVTLQISMSSFQIWQLKRVEKQIDQQIRDVITQTLPGTQVGDTRKARQLFEAPLSAARGGHTQGGLLRNLNILTETLEQASNTRMDAFSYQPKSMDLRLSAPDTDALAKVQQLINEQGLHADLQSATPRDNKWEGRMQLKLPGI
jgi:general secretion pathway protein L